VPYVDNAVIVDTGSVDGTREILEELESKYPNLRVFDKKWEGYANGRNFSIDKADTANILVLDADERIVKEDFTKLKRDLENSQVSSYELPIVYIGWDGIKFKGGGHNPRLFKKGLGTFKSAIGRPWEYLRSKEGRRIYSQTYSEVTIKHFLSTETGQHQKMVYWYDSGAWEKGLSPTQVRGCSKWKQLNPQRPNYPGLIQL